MQTRRFTSFEDRQNIERLIKQGKDLKSVAIELGLRISTVQREVRLVCPSRTPYTTYTAEAAQNRAQLSRKKMGNRTPRLIEQYPEFLKKQMLQEINAGTPHHEIRKILRIGYAKFKDLFSEILKSELIKPDASLVERVMALEENVKLIIEIIRSQK